MKSLMIKNMKVALPRVLVCLVFYILVCIVTGKEWPMFAAFMMNLACIIIAQDSKEMVVESSWPVDKRGCVDVRYFLILMTMALFCLVMAVSGRDALGSIGMGCFITSLSAGTVFPLVTAGKNFWSGLISGASSAVIVIMMMDGEASSIIPWYAFMLLAVAVLIGSRMIAMRIWMKGGSQR